MYTRCLSAPLQQRKSFFLFGPRGVGKSAWLRTQLPKALYFDLLAQKTFRQLYAHPEMLEELIPRAYHDWIVIDEIQKIPALLNEVHRLIETNQYRFILTGSSARALRRKGVNLLAGRAINYYMFPLTSEELGDDFSMQHALQYGLLPEIFHRDTDPETYLDAYINNYIFQEVKQESLTRQLDAFLRFLQIASFSQGAIVNYSSIAREIGVSQPQVKHYFEILDDLLMSYHLPVFTKHAKRRLVQREKFYFFDVGVYKQLRPIGLLDAPEEINGAAMETLFLQEFNALNHYHQLDLNIYYWRTSTGTEVDFIIYGKDFLYAFEVKHASVLRSGHLTGLRSFKKDYPMATLFLINNVDQPIYYDDITVIPMARLFKHFLAVLQGQLPQYFD